MMLRADAARLPYHFHYYAYARQVFASTALNILKVSRCPDKTGATTFESLLRSLINRDVVTRLVKKRRREKSTRDPSGMPTSNGRIDRASCNGCA
jgi:hypothetical protein